MSCAKPFHFILYHSFVLLLLHSFPCICLLCILFPPLEDAQSLEGSAPFSLLGLATCSWEVLPAFLDKLIRLLSVKVTKNN